MYTYQSPLQSVDRPYYEERPSARFTPQAFRYNGRVAAALLPSLFVLASYGGTQVAAALVVRFSCIWYFDSWCGAC